MNAPAKNEAASRQVPGSLVVGRDLSLVAARARADEPKRRNSELRPRAAVVVAEQEPRDDDDVPCTD